VPGPKSTPVKGFKFPVGKPNRRQFKRLSARQNDYDMMIKSASNPSAYTRPGSQNRNK
jgi:hypothetical protein